MPHIAFRFASTATLFAVVLFCALSVWANPGKSANVKSQAAAGSLPKGPLRVDSLKVHSLYLDGEFDAAIAILEANLKETRQYRHDDSVFMFKHLGIMYAAQYDTREKGKYYMHRLLTVEPTAKIMDMYASDMIYMIFRNIQDEFEQSRSLLAMQSRKPGRHDSAAASSGPRPEMDSAKADRHASAAPQTSGGRKWVWSGAAAATLAAGVGAYFLLSDQEPDVVRRDFRF